MPTVKFASKIQAARFERLAQHQTFYDRVKKEVCDPILQVQAKAHSDMNMALAEIGVPLDKRDIRLFAEEGYIFFEDEDYVWDLKEGKAVERSPESKAEWLKAHPKPIVPPAPAA